MGPNGAGKSTLGYALMGNPKYQITGSKIYFKERRPARRARTSGRRMVCSCPSRSPLEVAGTFLGQLYPQCSIRSKQKDGIRVCGISRKN